MAECLHDLLQCSICLERFTQPKMLPCQHTFCLSCLRGIIKDDKTLACPQCRVEHQLPKGGVDGLTDNMTIKSFLNVIGEEASPPPTGQAACFDCGLTASLSECQHCKEHVCADCRASHAKILAEIEVYLKYSYHDDSNGRANNAEPGKGDCFVSFSKKIAETEAVISNKFDGLRTKILEKITERERNLRRFLDTLKTRVSTAEPDLEKSRLTGKLNEELSTCKTTSALEEFKILLETTERFLSAYLQDSEADIQIDIHYDEQDFLERLVTLKIGDGEETVVRGFGNMELCGTKGQGSRLNFQSRSFEKTQTVTLPTHVNYQAKDGTLKSIIEKHPESTKTLVPDSAVYSQKLASIFCVSEGEVLVYPLAVAKGGQVLSPLITACTHIAATDSGKVIVAEKSTVTVFDLDHRLHMEMGSATPKLEIKVDEATSIDQICCCGKEYGLLARTKILIFDEDGHLIRQFPVRRQQTSRMTVDQNGQIYLTTAIISKREEMGVKKGCHHFKEHSQLRVTVTPEINVWSWSGQKLGKFELANIIKLFNYKFDQQCVFCASDCRKNYYIRNDGSPPNVLLITETLKESEFSDIRGLCVDGDGFLSLALANEIRVYKQNQEIASTEAGMKPVGNEAAKLETVGSVGDHMSGERGFAGELGGISLMPDGRMIICERGSNRIVIL